MKEYTDNISVGTAAILVKDDSLKESGGDFIKYLRSEGFGLWTKSKGRFDGVDWVYVNLNSRTYAYGMPGIPITIPFGDHAVTSEEFRTIYEIYRKYEGTSVFAF